MHASSAGWPRKWLLLHATILSAVAVFFLFTLRDGHGWGGDFAQYIHHAKNIAEGEPYADTGYVYNPLNPVVGPQAYPPVFPLSLSPAYKLFGLSLTAMKIQLVFVFIASLVVTARLFSYDLGVGRTLVYTLLIGFSPILWRMKDAIMSEHLFILLWYLTVLVADHWYRGRKVFRSEAFHAVLLGTLIYLSYGARSVGIVLLPTVVVCEWFSARRLTRFGALALATAVGLIFLQKVLLPASGQGYLTQLGQIGVGSVLNNLYADAVSFTFLWENGYSEGVREVAGVLLGVLGLVGFCRGNLPKPSFLGAAMVFYFVLIVLWPTGAWTRMIVPLLPGYVFYVLLGTDLPRIRLRSERLLTSGLCLFAAVSYAGSYSRADYGPIDGVETRSAEDLFEFVRENTEPEDVCVFFKPRVLSLYADRPATAYPLVETEPELWEYVESKNGSVLIVREDAGTDAERMARDRTPGLVEIWRNDTFRVLRLGPGR